MKTNLQFLKMLWLFAILLPNGLSLAQSNYNAGTDSGTGGTNNVFVGYSTGRITTGSGNIFVGAAAGYYNTSGTYNSFLGNVAGFRNTTGSYNCFIGTAGYNNSSGSSNSFVGFQAGDQNTTGSQNSFIGSQAGYSNTTGAYNSFLGSVAGYSNTTGSYNSFVGTAGYRNTTGSSNSFVGFQAGDQNTTGIENSFFGFQAGDQNTTGYYNSFLGSQAGYSNTTGMGNSFLGAYSGYFNTTGYNNSFVGYRTGFSNTTGAENSFLGRSTGYANTTGYGNSFVGNYAGYNTTTGSENVFLGKRAGEKNTSGFFNVSLGNYAGPTLANLQNAGAIGYRATVSASNSLVLGSINGENGATADTKVGIGTAAPAYLLHVNGVAAKPGGGSWTVATDRRLKQNISEFKDGLALVQQIKPVWFEYNGKAALPRKKRYVGVIAQEMQKVAPYTIGEFVYTDTTGKQEKYLDYDANALTYMLVNAVKEQQQQLAQKDDRIGALEKRLQQLEQLFLQQQPNNGTTQEDNAAMLYQNEPNPTDGSTVIRYHIPAGAVRAQLKLFSPAGQELQSFELSERGEGQLTIAVGRLAAGTYVYRLLVDGRVIAARKLLLTH